MPTTYDNIGIPSPAGTPTLNMHDNPVVKGKRDYGTIARELLYSDQLSLGAA